MNNFLHRILYRPDGTSKTSAFGAGGMGFKSRADQISHTLQRLATVATLILIVWALVQSRGDGHRSLVTPERVLSEKRFYFYNKIL